MAGSARNYNSLDYKKNVSLILSRYDSNSISVEHSWKKLQEELAHLTFLSNEDNPDNAVALITLILADNLREPFYFSGKTLEDSLVECLRLVQGELNDVTKQKIALAEFVCNHFSEMKSKDEATELAKHVLYLLLYRLYLRYSEQSETIQDDKESYLELANYYFNEARSSSEKVLFKRSLDEGRSSGGVLLSPEFATRVANTLQLLDESKENQQESIPLALLLQAKNQYSKTIDLCNNLSKDTEQFCGLADTLLATVGLMFERYPYAGVDAEGIFPMKSVIEDFQKQVKQSNGKLGWAAKMDASVFSTTAKAFDKFIASLQGQDPSAWAALQLKAGLSSPRLDTLLASFPGIYVLKTVVKNKEKIYEDKKDMASLRQGEQEDLEKWNAIKAGYEKFSQLIEQYQSIYAEALYAWLSNESEFKNRQSLSVRFLHLNTKCIDLVANIIRKNPGITSVDLHRYAREDTPTDKVNYLLESLLQLPTIYRLNLSAGEISDQNNSEGFALLKQLLKQSQQLTHFIFEPYRIRTGKNLEETAEILGGLSHLERLELNNFGGKGKEPKELAAAFMDALIKRLKKRETTVPLVVIPYHGNQTRESSEVSELIVWKYTEYLKYLLELEKTSVTLDLILRTIYTHAGASFCRQVAIALHIMGVTVDMTRIYGTDAERVIWGYLDIHRHKTLREERSLGVTAEDKDQSHSKSRPLLQGIIAPADSDANKAASEIKNSGSDKQGISHNKSS